MGQVIELRCFCGGGRTTRGRSAKTPKFNHRQKGVLIRINVDAGIWMEVRYMMRSEAQACATFEAQETSKDDPSLLLSSPPLSSFPPSSSLLFSSPSGLVKLLSMRSLGF